MTYFKCSARCSGGAYAVDFYDLNTDIGAEIIEILKARGWDVLEVWGIVEQ